MKGVGSDQRVGNTVRSVQGHLVLSRDERIKLLKKLGALDVVEPKRHEHVVRLLRAIAGIDRPTGAMQTPLLMGKLIDDRDASLAQQGEGIFRRMAGAGAAMGAGLLSGNPVLAGLVLLAFAGRELVTAHRDRALQGAAGTRMTRVDAMVTAGAAGLTALTGPIVPFVLFFGRQFTDMLRPMFEMTDEGRKRVNADMRNEHWVLAKLLNWKEAVRPMEQFSGETQHLMDEALSAIRLGPRGANDERWVPRTVSLICLFVREVSESDFAQGLAADNKRNRTAEHLGHPEGIAWDIAYRIFGDMALWAAEANANSLTRVPPDEHRIWEDRAYNVAP